MTQMQTHPTEAVLTSFVLGKLANPDDAAVASHLTECRECEARAGAVNAADTLVSLLAAAGTHVDAECSAAATPTLDAAATPAQFAPTQGWGGAEASDETIPPPILAAHPKYRTVRPLGAGGMGTVWLAEHAVMNRLVAVKVIRPDLLARPGASGRFLREVQAAAKLHHANIVTAFDAEPVGDSCLLVMEYVPGDTLADQVEEGPLSVVEACRAVRDAARGLAHAHQAGLVHRDVKPHNLIRDANGTVKVLDFGLAGVSARTIDAAAGSGLTGAGMVVGTPDYIAPEQAADPRTADARSDIYGLGCTFYHLLAGRTPFAAATLITEKLRAQQQDEPAPIPGLPVAVAAMLAKMLAKRPEDRYQTADEVATALEPFAAARPVKPRRRWLALAAAAAILAVLAAGIIYYSQTPTGVVRFEINDPAIKVEVEEDGHTLTQAGQEPIKVSVGNHRLHITRGDFVFDASSFEMKRGKETTIKVDFLEGFKLQVVQDGVRIGSAEVSQATTDHQLLQGTWKGIAGMAMGQRLPDEQVKQVRVTFTGDIMEGPPSPGNKGGKGRFVLDPGKTPKRITLTDDANRNAVSQGIYGFLDNNTLRICMSAPEHGSIDEFGGKIGLDITLRRDPAPDSARRRNPFGVPDVDDPDGGDVQAFAARTKLTGGADDPNAEQWVTNSTTGNPSSLDGEWHGRWWNVQGESWKYCKGTVQIKSVGERVYILSTDNTDTILMDLRHQKDRLIGRFQGIKNRSHGGPFVLLIVNPDRLDGMFHEGALTGRQDFRRKLEATRGEPTDKKLDHELLQGTWRGVAAEIGGKQMPQEFIDMVKPTLTFSADKLTGKPQGRIPKEFLDLAIVNGIVAKDVASLVENGVEGVYHLDPSKSPRQIDFSFLGPVRKTALGIYQLEGDTLKLCLAINPEKVAERPTEFATRAGEPRVILTLKRLPPAEVRQLDIEPLVDPSKAEGNVLPVALLERNGVTALRFGKWLLVFEGVACDSKGTVLLGMSGINYPIVGGRGEGTLEFGSGLKSPGPEIRQKWDSKANELSVNNYRFKLKGKGTRLEFADRGYDAGDQVQTIVVARDGSTRLEPSSPK